MLRLYVVVRQDIDPGYQIAQSLHAFREFVHYFPEIEKNWYQTSNTIIIKGIANERELLHLGQKAIRQNIKFATFREPDLGDQLTAVAFEPGDLTAAFLAELPLACSEFRTKAGTPDIVPTNV